ncbi:shikimate kinase [Mycobacterium hackensackense]|uniref:shikimate kinase n=1 Tax=Mycobacterium hackensackense TaxID=228909 RepID=UPI002265CDAF|nr:AAA family ATPase [Mycobacterium hackensackense]
MELDSRAQNNLKTSPVDLFPTERFNNAMPAHTAVLVTGMSGVGKTTALDELARRGYTTVDTDDAHWIDIVDGEPLWREPLINDLLSRPPQTPIFIQGTVANQGAFYHRFDAIVLLSAPRDLIFDRLARRTNNPFGKTPQQRQRIADDIAEVEPLLRQAATHEIQTTRTPAEVVNLLIDIAVGQATAH